MKTALLFFLSLFFLQLSGQNLNVAGHSFYYDEPGNVVSVNSKSYYYYLNTSDCCQSDIHVIGVNEEGQTLFNDSIDFDARNVPLKLIKTLDKSLVLLGYGYYSCFDESFPMLSNRFVKLDTTGTVIFSVTVQTQHNQPVKDIAQHADGSYWLATDSLVYHYSSSGQFINLYGWGMTGISSIAALPDSNLLFNAKVSGVAANIKISASGSVIAQQSTASTIQKFICSSSGELYAKTASGSIERYNSGLTLLGTAGLINVTDFALRNDSVFAVGTITAGSKPYYCVLSSSLGLLYQTQASYKNVWPTGITLTSKNKVSIITRASSLDQSMPFRSYYLQPLTGSFLSHSDIGVVGISVISSTFVEGNDDFNFPAHNDSYFNVTVKNYGPDTITSFYLNHSSNLFNYCIMYHKLFTTVILPHDSVVVQSGLVNGNGVYILNNTPLNTPLYSQDCIYTTVPNASGDINIDNDATCIQQLVLVTGIATYNKSAAAITLFPNPFTGSLHIQSDAEIKQLEIYNALGMLQQSVIVNKRDVTLDNSCLAPGIYFIKLQTETGSLIKKVIKE